MGRSMTGCGVRGVRSMVRRRVGAVKMMVARASFKHGMIGGLNEIYIYLSGVGSRCGIRS